MTTMSLAADECLMYVIYQRSRGCLVRAHVVRRNGDIEATKQVAVVASLGEARALAARVGKVSIGREGRAELWM